MNQADLDKIIQKTIDNSAGIMIAKGAEYANSDTDRLANFKRNAENLGLQPLQVAGVFASKHWDSINSYIKNLAKGRAVKLSEPIESRFYDLVNYCNLMLALIEDQHRSVSVSVTNQSNDKINSLTPEETVTGQTTIRLNGKAFNLPVGTRFTNEGISFQNYQIYKTWAGSIGIEISSLVSADYPGPGSRYTISIKNLRTSFLESLLRRESDQEIEPLQTNSPEQIQD